MHRVNILYIHYYRYVVASQVPVPTAGSGAPNNSLATLILAQMYENLQRRDGRGSNNSKNNKKEEDLLFYYYYGLDK